MRVLDGSTLVDLPKIIPEQELKAIIEIMVDYPNGVQVGAFLDEYRPNDTFYLPMETRQHLRDIGHAVTVKLAILS